MRKPTKRKMYQKRRKREKAEQRKKDTQSMVSGKPASFLNKYRKQAQAKQYSANSCHQLFSVSPITSYSQGLQLWWRNYCSAIEFHSQQHLDRRTDDREDYSMLFQKYADEYETSSEEEEEKEIPQWPDTRAETGITEQEYVDQEYMKFLEITYKHREEMRLKRAEDNC